MLKNLKEYLLHISIPSDHAKGCKELSKYINAKFYCNEETYKALDLIAPQKYKLFEEVVAKKTGNCIFFIKGKIQSLLSKLPPKDPEENKEQEPKINIQKEYSKNVYNKNQLQFQNNQSKFVLLQYPLQYNLPKIEIIKILLDQSPDFSPTNTFPENITPSSVMIFGTSHNLFYAIGFCDLLIIADSQMSVIDKFFFD